MSGDKRFNIFHEYSIVQGSQVLISKQVEYYLWVKRILDFLLASLGIIIAAPIVVLFAVLIVLETPGSPFYIQQRVGRKGEYFYLIKLRSMKLDAEKDGAKWAEANDPRVTKIGSFIRKTRIDELPQLLCVLKGDMSIIGPRPERPCFTAKFDREIAGFSNRLAVKPGLTGLAQVNGGYNITPKEKLKYDLEYISNLKFSLEMKILAKTVKVILTGEGAR
ncbi:sugar transferase [Niallia nealsonii]|uniref:UDP-phosphate N-acetylgalactosaminyl-1-phosphate transferase n=1 Tax=Niallia nealsonii TaxID=115979 RepID=A0A2N0YYF3_9BACI|nr:sugar transferase [Niallia nealsonii]PKG22289.1 UDP-phosphate N-acetylgalactosaminyl-1-phosphate transferase [Niallia nealsonii]